MANKNEPINITNENEYKTEIIQQLGRIERYTRSMSGWITFIGILIIIAVAVQLLDSCSAAMF